MTPESKPQNIEPLLERSQMVDKIISRVTDLIVEPGGNAWPNNLSLANSSGAEYLRRAALVGKETEILNEDALPMLERLKRETNEQINPALKDLNSIKELVQKKILPESVLTKAEEEFQKLKKEPILKGEPTGEAPKPAPATLQIDLQQDSADQLEQMLVIPGYNSIPKKPNYPKEDLATMLGTDDKKTTYIINKAKLIDTSIEGDYGTGDDHRRLYYTEEEMRKIVNAEEARPKRKTRAAASGEEHQVLPKPKKDNETQATPKADALTFQVNGKDITIPKKEFYTNEDIATAIARDKRYVSAAVARAKTSNPTIAAEYLITNYAKILSFNEDNFIKIVTDIISRMRRPYKRREAQDAPELERDNEKKELQVPQVSDLVSQGTNDYTVRERRRRKLPTRLEPVTLPDGKTVVNLPPRQVPILKSLIAAGEQGLSNDEITDIFYTGITKPLRARAVGNIALSNIKMSLTGSGHKIDNLTRRIDYAKGLKARYVFRKDPILEKPPTQDSSNEIYLAPESTIIAPEKPDAQIAEEETIFLADQAEPAKPKETQEAFVTLPDGVEFADLTEQERILIKVLLVRREQKLLTTLEECKERFMAAGGDPETTESAIDSIIRSLQKKISDLGTDYIIDNPLQNKGGVIAHAYILRKPLWPKNDPEQTEARARQSPREQVLTRATHYILSKLAERHPEEISRNVRVILGNGLPPRSTIPAVFGKEVTDEGLKTELVNVVSSALERFWSPDPKKIKDVSEDESKIIEICSLLSRQHGNSIRSIVHETSNILRTLPPRRYRAA